MNILKFVSEGWYRSGIVPRGIQSVSPSKIQEGIEWIMDKWRMKYHIVSWGDCPDCCINDMFDDFIDYICNRYKIIKPENIKKLIEIV